MTVCTTVMVVVRAYLLEDLPYPGAERLYSVHYAAPGQDEPERMEALDWTALADVIEYPIAWDLDMFYVLGEGNAESVPGAWVTPGFVAGLGISPARGRLFDAKAFAPGSANVALISHHLWMTRFNGDESIVGRSFTAYVSDRPEEAERFTIIGVLPRDFWHVNQFTDILAPLRAPTYPYLVRLRPGVTTGAAEARITALVRAGAAKVPAGWKADLVSTRTAYVARLRPVLRSVSAAAVLVLFVGCANVAGLLLLRGARRQREIAVRTALGASPTAIIRMLGAEALLLGAAATATALVATRFILVSVAPLVQHQLGRSAPRGDSAFVFDVPMLLAAAGAGLATALSCALAPAIASFRPGFAASLQSVTRTTTEGRRSHQMRAGLIALEVAASLALLSGSALMLRTVVSLVRADLGFETRRTLLVSITLRQNKYPDEASRVALYDRVQDALSEVDGVTGVGLSSSWPLQQQRVRPLEAEVHGRRVPVRAAIHAVSAGYFQTLDIPILAGRPFGASDRQGSQAVAIVSETLARRLWPDGSAVGSDLLVPNHEDAAPTPRAIVGITGDVRQDATDDDLADVYVPMPQGADRFAVAFVRTQGPPAEWLPPVRSAFERIDPDISLSNARPLQAALEESRTRPEFIASLLGAFSGVTTFVALVGVYGMMAYAVRQREREVAVRMAIGADPRRVTLTFVREGGIVLALGLSLGTLGALAAGRLLESQLYGVAAADPAAVGAAAVAFGTVGMVAVWWPSRRAARTDPAIALRSE